MMSDCIRFSEVISGYKFRNMLKPGITGLAQIKGYRGPTHDSTSIVRRFQYDAFYVRNSNFWLDLRILRTTIVQMSVIIFNKARKLRSGEQQKGSDYEKIAA